MADIQLCTPGTILAAPRAGTDQSDFFQITNIVSLGTVEVRQIVTTEGGNPVANAFIAPPLRVTIGIAVTPDTLATVWKTSPEPRR